MRIIMTDWITFKINDTDADRQKARNCELSVEIPQARLMAYDGKSYTCIAQEPIDVTTVDVSVDDDVGILFD